jgi:hypothetical protein
MKKLKKVLAIAMIAIFVLSILGLPAFFWSASAYLKFLLVIGGAFIFSWLVTLSVKYLVENFSGDD